MGNILFLSNEDVESALDVTGYIEAMEEIFKDWGCGLAVTSPRTETSIPLRIKDNNYVPDLAKEIEKRVVEMPLNSDRYHSPEVLQAGRTAETMLYRLKTMAGGYPRGRVMALRIDSTIDTHPVVNGRRRSIKLPLASGWKYVGLVLLFNIVTGELLAVIQDGHLQRMRVAATTALGLKVLSREDSESLGLLGSGWQSEAQLKAACAIRKINRVKVYSPTRSHRNSFAVKMEKELGIEVTPVDHARKAVLGADIVIGATTSQDPVLEGAWLRDGMHLTSINPREVDMRAFAKPNLVVVNIRPNKGKKALIENYVMGGDNVQTIGSITGAHDRKIKWQRTVELREVLIGQKPGRTRNQEITFHANNIGLGLQFAAAGIRVYRSAIKKGLGKKIPLEWILQKAHT